MSWSQRHTLRRPDKGPPAGCTGPSPCWTRGRWQCRSPQGTPAAPGTCTGRRTTSCAGLRSSTSEKEGNARQQLLHTQDRGQDPPCPAALPAPGAPQAHLAAGHTGAARGQPGAQTPGPSRRGGSYLPRRCRPPIRVCSRPTGLCNRQTAPRWRVSDGAPRHSPPARPGPRAVRPGSRVDEGAADHPAGAREHLSLRTSRLADLSSCPPHAHAAQDSPSRAPDKPGQRGPATCTQNTPAPAKSGEARTGRGTRPSHGVGCGGARGTHPKARSAARASCLRMVTREASATPPGLGHRWTQGKPETRNWPAVGLW